MKPTLLPSAALLVMSQLSAQDLRPDVLHLLRDSRTIDGTGNNLTHSTWGSADTAFTRWTLPAYADGVSTPSGGTRPNARAVSNTMCAQGTSRTNAAGASDMVWQWGQFLDHDIDETPLADPAEDFSIAVPTGDPEFDPTGTGTQTIRLSRSAGEISHGARQQINAITSFVDGSNVYGADAVRARELRVLDGTGKLKTSAGDLLPFNTAGLPNAPFNSSDFFLAGDVRANEQVALTAMHTLFVREHNFWAERIARLFTDRATNADVARTRRPGPRKRHSGHGYPRQLTGEEIYQAARAIVGAELQVITYHEFLPIVLGRGALTPYRGYRRAVDPSIANEFATASYRFGHTMLSPTLRRLGPDLQPIAAGDLPLQQGFFEPDEIVQHGIEPLLRGLATQRAQEIDTLVIDDVRNFLFGAPGAGGFDLASLNVQRGRDHGLDNYNQVRVGLGLRRRGSMREISSRRDVRQRLSATYGDVDQIDLWIGGLAEDPVPGALVGETLRTVLARQFQALRDGDRYYYANHLTRRLQRLVEQQSLARVIRRNTSIDRELPNDVWHAR